jgi:inosine-uridine nucleoside N-ribohydrolase
MNPTLSTLTEPERLTLLEPPTGRVRMVLDTDTFNEIDDQFAIVYAVLAQERIDFEAIYAAPFHNERSTGPGDGMEKSYEEIVRVLERLGRTPDGFVHRGSTEWLRSVEIPVESAAAQDLIDRAMQESERPLYVVAIGAITNVASALLTTPEIADRIVVVWLGGHPYNWYHTVEFNLRQDLIASRLMFDCGVPFVRVPCINVTEHLITTLPEMETYVKGRGAIGDYLYDIFANYRIDHYARSKQIWDIGPIAWLIEPEWLPTALIHSPILTDERTFSHDPRRHFVREAIGVNRDAILGDLFRRIEKA